MADIDAYKMEEARQKILALSPDDFAQLKRLRPDILDSLGITDPEPTSSFGDALMKVIENISMVPGTSAGYPEITEADVQALKSEGIEFGAGTAGGAGGGTLGALAGTAVGGPIGGVLGAAIGGGIGSQVAEEGAEYLGGTERPASERVMRGGTEALLGAVIPGLGSAAKRAFTTGADSKVAKILTDYASGSPDELVEALAKNKITGRTTADVLQDPGLATLEGSIRRSGRPSAQQFVDQDIAREEMRDALLEAMTRNIKSTPGSRGADIKEGLEAGYSRSKEAVNQAFKEIDPGGDVEIDLSTIKGEIENSLKMFSKSKKGEGLSQEMQSLVNDIIEESPDELSRILSPTGEPIVLSKGGMGNSMEQIQNMRSRALDMAQDATPRKEKALNNIARILDSAVERKMYSGEVPEEVLSKWRKARALRAEQGEVFEKGVTKDLLRSGRGIKGVDPEDVERKLLTGKKTTVQQFLKGTEDSPEARRALKEATREAIKKGVRGGETLDVRVGKLNDFLNKNAEYMTDLYDDPVFTNVLTQIRDDLLAEKEFQKLSKRIAQGQSITTPSANSIKFIEEALSGESKGKRVGTLLLEAAAVGTAGFTGGGGGAVVAFLGAEGLKRLRQARSDTIMDGLIDIMVDPNKAKLLLQNATSENVALALDDILMRGAAVGAGDKLMASVLREDE